MTLYSLHEYNIVSETVDYIDDSRKTDVYSIGAIISESLAFGFNITPERYDRFRA